MPDWALPYCAAAAPVVTETSSKPLVPMVTPDALVAPPLFEDVPEPFAPFEAVVPAAAKPLPRLPGWVETPST